MVKRAFGLGKKHVFDRLLNTEISVGDAKLWLSGILIIAVVVFSLFIYKTSLGNSAPSSTQKTAVAATTDTVDTKENTPAPVEQAPAGSSTETTPVAQQPAATSTETATPAAAQTTSAEDAEYQAWLDKVCPGTQQWIDEMDKRYGSGYSAQFFQKNLDPKTWKTFYEACVAAGRMTALY